MSQSTTVYGDVRERLREALIGPGHAGDRLPSERELARTFGVSPVTISRALQELQNEGLVRRVVGKGTFIDAPAPAALVQQAAGLVAAIIAPLSDDPPSKAREYWTQRASTQLERSLQGAGGRTALVNHKEVIGARIGAEWDRLLADGVNAAVLIGDAADAEWSAHLWRWSQAAEKPPPIVTLSFSPLRSWSFDAVRFDGGDGARLATQHLLELGHREIAFLAPPVRWDWVAERVEGFRQALLLAGLADVDGDDVGGRVVAGELLPKKGSPDYWRLIGADAAERLLARPGVTAVVAANDHMAHELLPLAAERGRLVPEALSVTGFDDIYRSAAAGLTTVHPPIEEMAEAAAGLLVERRREPAPRQRTELILRPLLVVRSSTRAAGAPAIHDVSQGV